ncbi:MAG: PatB family C-S lyase [Bacteroidales bacterium]|nr:PatB family C-S lyase [Bacteroidales bacterium]MDG2080342.1 PatB family C-S lyase [Bacteroidales bacterium]|tara:strand:- start:2471 stop:3631 length:1161 start_codon:yes stop_codon:yes gene_type:complete
MYDFDKIVERENTSSIKYDMRMQMFGKEDITPLWVADMDFETPDFVREAIVKRAQHPIYGYSLRGETYTNSIIDWVERKHDWKINEDWIVFSPGIVPALNFATLALTKPGDAILVQPPVYFPFFTAATDHDRILTESTLIYKHGGYTIDFDDFAAKAKYAKLFFFSSPHNPTGRVWTREELVQIASICLDNDVIIVSDEIHNDLIFPNKKHIPIATISDEIADITITCIAPSKTFNLAGMATSSLIISNHNLREKMQTIIDSLHISLGNVFGAIASEAAYTHGYDWVIALMEYVSGNLDVLRSTLISTNSRIKLVEPEATYMAWLDFNDTGYDDDKIKNIIINEAKLGLSHGPIFGVGGSGFQRINLASPRTIVSSASDRLCKVFK